jgi:adenylyltransferase/sulfurtransferase
MDVTYAAAGFPPPIHPAEADLFCRQTAMPGHNQARVEAAHIVVVGCGGLGSWMAVALARLGVRQLTLIDPDQFDRTNAPRQLMFAADLGTFKAHAVARNIVAHMTNAGTIRALAMPFERALACLDTQIDAVAIGVDHNATRLTASRWTRQRQVPAVFAMLSQDGLRMQVFLQRPTGACLSCVLPNLAPEAAAPCAAASITSCLLASAHAGQLLVSALCDDRDVPSWRETSLDGTTERSARPRQRTTCPHGEQ